MYSDQKYLKPTLFEPKNCLKKGLFQVAINRSQNPYNLYYEIHGSSLDASKKLLFSFNTGCSGWFHQVEYFKKKCDHQVLVIDNRGVGNSETGSYIPYKTVELARDVIDILDHLGWTEERSINICGLSMGGMISQQLGRLIPNRIRSLMLVSTKAGDQLDCPSLEAVHLALKVLTKTTTIEERVDHAISSLYPHDFLAQPISKDRTERDRIREFFLSRLRHTKPQPRAGKLGQISASVCHRLSSSELQKISQALKPAKILVLGGQADLFISPTRMIELSDQLSGSELILLEDGGHNLNIQFPELFNQIFERVISEAHQRFSK